MNTPTRSIGPLAAARWLPGFVTLALLPGFGFAQGATTGTVRGRVYNPASSEYVNNAEVRLDGTNQRTYTAHDGAFEFLGVAAGPASITVNYSGYNEARESFNVAADGTVVREINLVSTMAAPG